MQYINSLVPFFAEAAPRQQNYVQLLLMFGIAIFFFYFILWRPERKRRKKMEEQRSSMKSGDRIIAMGLVGTLDKVEDNTVVLKTVDGSKIEVLKASISEVTSKTATETVSDK